jgi:X-Pro dipeptidyl-peptidase
MEPMKAALLMSHGFNDWNVMPEHSYRIYNAARAKGIPSMIFYHQNGHGGPPPFSMMNRWFTRYLHGVENGVEKEPRAWIVREQDERTNPTAYADFPNPQASDVTFHLKGAAPAAGSLSLDQVNLGIKETLIDNYSFSGSALAQAEISEHRLLYLSPVLQESVHISGVPKITVKLASSKPAANLSVWLVSLPWTEGSNSRITDNIITRGWADPQNHKDIRHGEPLEPGKFYEVTFELQPDDQIIPAGQQIGLMIFSSDSEFTILPNPGTELTVDLDGTVLTLPVVGGKASVEKAVK